MNDDKNKKDELIPLEQVLDDMYSNGYISSAARDYYYFNYASESEHLKMDREDKIQTIIAIVFVLSMPALIIIKLLFDILR
jgi:hypothetical protein